MESFGSKADVRMIYIDAEAKVSNRPVTVV